MATRSPLVIASGQIEQLQAGDELLVATAVADVRTMTNGESSSAIVIGMAVYIFAAGSVKRAQANALSTADVLGLMRDTSVAAAGSGQIVVGGILVATTGQWDAVTGQTGGLTAGARYFLDPVTPGKITSTAPTTVGQVVICLGRALSLTDFEVDTDATILL